jgi:hypothetical protein
MFSVDSAMKEIGDTKETFILCLSTALKKLIEKFNRKRGFFGVGVSPWDGFQTCEGVCGCTRSLNGGFFKFTLKKVFG